MKLGFSDFFRDIGNFFQFKSVLGVDIGTVSIKAVEVSRRGDELVLENYGIITTKGYLQRANEAIQTSSLKLSEKEVARLLGILIREMRPATRNVVVSAPLFAAFVVPVEMPVLSPEETAKSITFQARQYIPLPLKEVSYEWTKIEEFTTPQGGRFQRVLITAVPNEIIRKYRNIFKAVGLKLSSVEVESQAIIRALSNPNDPPIMIVDIGAESTSITIEESGVLKHVGETDYGGASLTQALARSLNISHWRAEELKRRRGLLGFGGEYELSTSLLPFLDVIIQECGRTARAYERMYGKKIQNFILIGGGAYLPGIREYMASQLGLHFLPARPFVHFKYPEALEPVLRFSSNELAVAAGLALRVYV